jgi:hypothetical protein
VRVRPAPLLVGLAFALAGCGGSGPKATTTASAPRGPAKPVTVVIYVGTHGVAGGPVRRRLQQGQRVTLIVRSALADVVHVHGYDISALVGAHGRRRIPFAATIPGRFVVELEHRHLEIAELDVQ